MNAPSVHLDRLLILTPLLLQTVLFGLATFYWLPSSPQASRYFTIEQKAQVIRRLALDAPDDVEGADDFSWREVRKAFTSPQVLLAGVAQFSSGCTLYSFSIFTPQVRRSALPFSHADLTYDIKDCFHFQAECGESCVVPAELKT